MAALACSKILKALSKEEEDTDSSEATLALADEYEHKAIGELGPCAAPHVTPPGRLQSLRHPGSRSLASALPVHAVPCGGAAL